VHRMRLLCSLCSPDSLLQFGGGPNATFAFKSQVLPDLIFQKYADYDTVIAGLRVGLGLESVSGCAER
jgi:hypothetical protein